MTRWILLLSLLVGGIPGAWVSAAEQAEDPAALIAELSSPDPAVRESAANKLILMGRSARPALLEALRKAPSPETRRQAERILMEIPWFENDDPRPVKVLLRQYGSKTVNQRQEVVRGLAGVHGGAGWPAIIRILREEPDDTVRWTVVAVIGQPVSRHLEALRELETETNNAPALVAAGRAWEPEDREKAMRLYARAIELEHRRPTNDLFQLQPVLVQLQADALVEEKYQEAARLLRIEFSRNPGGSREPIFRLFALHARHGPLPGFSEDWARYSAYVGEPAVVYAAGKLAEKRGQFPLSQGLYQVAFHASGPQVDGRLDLADMLERSAWWDLAELELLAVVKLAEEQSPETAAQAHFRLAQIYQGRLDDFQVAEHMRMAMELREKMPGWNMAQADPETRRILSSVWADIHWHYWKAAVARGDEAQAAEHLEKMVQEQPTSPDIIMDIKRVLKERNREDEAEAIYESALKLLKDRPEGPEAQNNLAWFYARCGVNLEEALELATKAVQGDPASYAYLDTLAEVHFRLGNREEAVKLEMRALALHPGDQFIVRQLERFRNDPIPERN